MAAEDMFTKATTADKLMARFGLQPKVAQGYVEANW